MNYQNLSRILKAVAEPNRLKILHLLSCGEMCACDILEHFDFTQPTLSHHMKILEQVGLVSVRKDSKWHYYSLQKGATETLLNDLGIILNSDKNDCICDH